MDLERGVGSCEPNQGDGGLPTGGPPFCDTPCPYTSLRLANAVSQDIEIIAVGLLPENSLAEKLHTQNIKPFENLHSAIDYLFSQFKN